MAVKLKELDQLKDDFVSSVSHELRSPLAAISGYIELLLSKPLSEIAPEKQSKALQIIQESTQRLAHFINEILDLAKIKAGQVEIRPKSFDLKKMIEDVDSLFKALVEKKNIYMTVDVPENARELIADEDKIRQVLTNLISNALKFTPSQGKIRIAARNESEFIQISVADSGAGIPEESLETIFERFKQAANSAGDFAQKGTGLGLAIARGIVEAHSGQMWVESEVGKGATFYFTIPVTPFRKS
jgi:signal transduction histidine kinase